MSSTPEQKPEIVREAIDAINDGDAARLRPLVADDAALHGQGGQDLHGGEAVVERTVTNTAFPDAHLEIEDLLVDGDAVAVRMTFTGTHEGEMNGIEPTGEAIEIRVMAMYRIEDGQIVEGWFVEDDADTLSQLGVLQELTS